MVIPYEIALTAVYQALSELNLQRSRKTQIELSPHTVLVGENGELDSLDMANLILLTEQKARDAFGVEIDLTEHDPFSAENGYFRTVGTLASHISSLVQR